MREACLAAALSGMVWAAAVEHLIEGTANSPVRVIIYEDLQCPDCAEFRRVLDEKLLPKYATKVAFEHRDFPLAKHTWARKAAIASRFVRVMKPELDVEFRRYVMTYQPYIDAANFNEKLAAYAKEHGIDAGKAIAALDDPALAKAVQSDLDEGVARGIAHTPTVLVNGQPLVEHFTCEELSEAIDSELAVRH